MIVFEGNYCRLCIANARLMIVFMRGLCCFLFFGITHLWFFFSGVHESLRLVSPIIFWFHRFLRVNEVVRLVSAILPGSFFKIVCRLSICQRTNCQLSQLILRNEVHVFIIFLDFTDFILISPVSISDCQFVVFCNAGFFFKTSKVCKMCQISNYQLIMVILPGNFAHYTVWFPCDFSIISCDCCVISVWTPCDFRVIFFGFHCCLVIYLATS